jgi:hypothetical protein
VSRFDAILFDKIPYNMQRNLKAAYNRRAFENMIGIG